MYWFCHISIWIRHRYTRVPHPEPSSLLPPRTISLGHPSAPAPSIPYCASNLDWRLVSYWYYTCFNAILPNHPTLSLSQSPKDCSMIFFLFIFFVFLFFPPSLLPCFPWRCKPHESWDFILLPYLQCLEVYLTYRHTVYFFNLKKYLILPVVKI